MIKQVLPIALILNLAIAGSSNADGIRINGEFDDWSDKTPIAIDPTGDASAGGVDFGAITVASTAHEHADTDTTRPTPSTRLSTRPTATSPGSTSS